MAWLWSLTLLLATAQSGGIATNGEQRNVFAIIGAQGEQPGEFVQPRAIAASLEHKLFIVDKTGRVQRLNAQGSSECIWMMPDSAGWAGKPSGISVDAAGRVLVADTHHSRVVVFDKNGNELMRFGRKGLGSGELMLPTDVVVDRTGAIYVSEYGGNDRINKFDASGRFLFSFAGVGDGAAAVQRPSGLAVDHLNRLWVADTCNHRLCCFDSSGKLVQTIGQLGSGTGQIRYPRDIVILSQQHLAVVDHGNDRIVILAMDGTYIAQLGSPGRGQGQFNGPLNMTRLGDDLYVADSKNHRIVRLARAAGADHSSVQSTVLSLSN